MATNPIPRMETSPERLLIGLRQKHAFSELPTAIPKQWAAFKQGLAAMLPCPVTYGVICAADQQAMEYLCGLEVASFEAAPDAADRIKIPQQKYAVFTHTGHISTIGESWKDILHTHLPALKLVDAHAPSFERYDDRYDPATGNGVVEIWCPIQ